MKKTAFATLLCLALTPGAVLAGETPSAPDARAYFIAPENGATVTSPVTIRFGLSGMGVAPAGAEGFDHTGHHHLLIDTRLEGEALNEPIPSDENHRHFGGGQTETIIELAPGRHRLQLVLGDSGHIPHDPPVMSEVIEIVVK